MSSETFAWKRATNMATITMKEAQATLSDLIHRLTPGEVVVITENDQPVAKLMLSESQKLWPCKAGSAKGKIRIAANFDEPLEEFREYMD
jgi:antitoxin (DNA-binding transcriptional repressor) of toxin-antitoxin stability system